MHTIGYVPALFLSPSAVSGKAALVMTRSKETATPETAVPVTTACNVAENESMLLDLWTCRMSSMVMLLDAGRCSKCIYK